MTLFKQMAIVLTIFLNIILVSVMFLNFQTATAFVQDQLYTNAKNTAHSLGLSLSKIVDPHDIASMETMINAIFDSGYYERIALISVDGQSLYVRETDVHIHDVPQWFVENVRIESAEASSDIMIGWSRLGKLDVSGHRGNAYRQLYHTFIDLFQTFTLIAISVLAFLYLLLSLSLKALKQIRRQAEGIIENRFILEPKMPFTTEFRSATVAMNAMVAKVKDIFERENETLVKYQELLYKDAETTLYNRRYLITKLPEYLKGDATLSQGLYVMFSLDGLEHYKKEQGYEKYKECIAYIVQGLSSVAHLPHDVLIRLSEADFFLLLPSAKIETIKNKLDTLLIEAGERIPMPAKEYLFIGVGIGYYNENDSLKTLLSRSDALVAQAKQQEEFTCLVETTQQHALVLSREEWRHELISALEDSRFILATQDVICDENGTQALVHKELFVRLQRSDGKIYTAGMFIPMAASLGLVDTIDTYMIEKAFKHDTKTPLAINLSAEFITKHSNLHWLKERLTDLQEHTRAALWFEVTNTIALHHLEAIISLSATLKMFGHRFGIDSFTLPQEGAYYLQAIRPDYLKCSVHYLNDIMFDATTGSNQESLNNLTRSLGISIIATNVEELHEREVLQKIGISYLQGRFIAPITLLDEGQK